jgi:hypothetical protein
LVNKTYCGPGDRNSDGSRITITKQTRQAAVEAVQQRAAERAAELAAIIKELQVGGAESLRAIAGGTEFARHSTRAREGLRVSGSGAVDIGAPLNVQRLYRG